MAVKFMWKQILNFVPVLLLQIISGISFGWTSSTLYQLQNGNFPITAANVSLIGSTVFYSKIFGSFLAYKMVSHFGRKQLLLLTSTAFTLQWAILTIFKSVPAILVSRLIFGIFEAINQSVYAIYAAENSYPEIRGSLIASLLIGFAVGKLSIFILVMNLSYYQVHGILTAMTFLITMSQFYVVESPEFLLSHSQFDKAKENYFHLRSVESKKDTEYLEKLTRNAINESSDHKRVNLYQLLSGSKVARRGLTIVIMITSLGQMSSGSAPIISYSTLLYSDGLNNAMITFLGIVLEVGFLTSAVLSTTLIARCRRRVFAKTGLVLQLVIMSYCAVLFTMHSMNPIENMSFYVVAGIFGQTMVFGIFIASLINCAIGEILPANIKSIGVSLSVSISSCMMAVMTSIFWPISKIGGIQLNFIIFAICTVMLFVYTHFQLPETHEKTLLDIESELGARKGNENSITLQNTEPDLPSDVLLQPTCSVSIIKPITVTN